MKCPCCSGQEYAQCCQPYHENAATPPTALALMRSRYSAYARGLVQYIIQTTHPQSPYFEKNREKWAQGISEFCQLTQFVKLEILGYGEDWVHFAAYLYRERFKNRKMSRRRPEFGSGEAGTEAAKLKKFSDAGGSQNLWLSDDDRTDSSITSGIVQKEPFILDEKSSFKKLNGKWLYLKATILSQ